MILRRLLLICCVLATLPFLPSCATPDVICDVRHYTSPVVIPNKGSVNLTWEYRQDLPQGTYGYATCDRQGKNCHLTIARVPDWNEVCQLSDFGHELLHALQANH